MSKVALFVRHRAQPGKRDEVQKIWAKYVQPRAAANPGHEAYFFCYDQSDAEVISVFQLYSSEAAMKEFLAGDWYPAYLAEVAQVVAAPPELAPASLVWNKADGAA